MQIKVSSSVLVPNYMLIANKVCYYWEHSCHLKGILGKLICTKTCHDGGQNGYFCSYGMSIKYQIIIQMNSKMGLLLPFLWAKAAMIIVLHKIIHPYALDYSNQKI